MPVALIVGAFGQDNPGDEALLDATVLAVRARAGWEPLVSTARPAETAARLGVATLPAGAPAAASAALRADALVVGGGTVFKELHPSSGRAPGALLRRATALTRAFHTRGRPVAMVGVGAAPIAHPASRQLARSIARHADLLVLRDAESADLLVEMGVPAPLRVGADLAWLSVARPDPVVVPDGAPIGVAVSHLADDGGAGGGTVGRRLVGALRPLLAAGHRVELEPWQGSPRLSADGRLAAQVASELGAGASVVQPPSDLTDAVRRASVRGVVVAMRFHAAVAAAVAGTRFATIAHEPKLAAIARRLGQPAVGVEDDPASLTAAIEHARTGPPPSARAVADERRRAQATADLLGLLLSGEGEAGRLVHLDLVPEPEPAPT